MKKYIIGALIGFVLSLGVGAHAEVVNMIGKVIDGSFPITIKGVTLQNPAITIAGISYVPTREFAESLGATVKFNADLGIEVVPSSTPSPASTGTPTPSPAPTPPPMTKEQRIEMIKSRISMLKPTIDMHKDVIEKQPDSPLVGVWKEYVVKSEKELSDIQAELNTLQK